MAKVIIYVNSNKPSLQICKWVLTNIKTIKSMGLYINIVRIKNTGEQSKLLKNGINAIPALRHNGTIAIGISKICNYFKTYAQDPYNENMSGNSGPMRTPSLDEYLMNEMMDGAKIVKGHKGKGKQIVFDKSNPDEDEDDENSNKMMERYRKTVSKPLPHRNKDYSDEESEDDGDNNDDLAKYVPQSRSGSKKNSEADLDNIIMSAMLNNMQ